MGVDWAMPPRTELLSPTETKVIDLHNSGKRGYGLYILLESLDGDYRFLYAHLTDALADGAFQEGEQVAISGGNRDSATSGSSTGPHLHFEVRRKSKGGWRQMDPLKYFSSLKQDPGGINVRKLFSQIWGRKAARGEELYFIKRVETGSIENNFEDMENKMKYWRNIVYPGGRFSFQGNLRWQSEKAKVLLGYG